MQIDDVLIQDYSTRFINRTDSWYRQNKNGYAHFQPGMEDSRYDYIPVTPSLIKAHIEGKVTAAWPLFDANGCGKYLAFDSDLLDGQLERLQDAWLDHNWKVLRTKGRADRDGHLFICLDEPIEGKYLIWLADAMMKYAGISGLERFPKSANSSSQLRGALGINRKIEANKARDWFVGPTQDVIEQLQWLAKQPLNSSAAAIELAKEHQPLELPPVLFKPTRKSFKDQLTKVTFEDAVRKTGATPGAKDWWNGRCPVPTHKHGDKHKSFGLRKADDGTAIPKCFTGCTPKEIYACLTRIPA